MTGTSGSELLAGVAAHAACFSPSGGRRPVEPPDEWGTYVLHVPIEAANLPAAVELARKLSAPLAIVDAAHVEDASVSHRGNQVYRWPLFCNQETPDGGCVLAPGHPPGCKGELWRTS